MRWSSGQCPCLKTARPGFESRPGGASPQFEGRQIAPVGQKTSHVNFKHKITSSANCTDSIGTVYTSHGKRLQNQSIRLDRTDAVMKWWCFPPKTSYKLGTDEK